MSLHNKILNEEFNVEGPDKVINYLTAADSGSRITDTAEGAAWQQTVGNMALGGLPDTLDDAFRKLESLEIAVRTHFAIESKRPGGARSKGTGYVLHPTFKSYKSTIKGAYESGVEILDAAGVPRSRNDISNDIKEARKVDKTPEEKLEQATQTFLTLLAGASVADPITQGCAKRVRDALDAAGL